jgi:hypothetical protein
MAHLGKDANEEIEKENITLRISKILNEKLHSVYGRKLSRMFEEDMLGRLIRDGYLTETGEEIPQKAVSGEPPQPAKQPRKKLKSKTVLVYSKKNGVVKKEED